MINNEIKIKVMFRKIVLISLFITILSLVYSFYLISQHKHEIGSIILILSSFNLVQDIKRLKNN